MVMQMASSAMKAIASTTPATIGGKGGNSNSRRAAIQPTGNAAIFAMVARIAHHLLTQDLSRRR
jgi:hypothetical protein